MASDHALVGVETPRLVASMRMLVAGPATDAPALRRIVEVQAEDLVRLRRELVSARHRLKAMGEGGAAPEPIADSADRVSDDQVLALLRAAQIDIEAVTRRSRWLRLGRQLGVARQTEWEQADWRSPYAEDTASSDAALPAGLLRAELSRLKQLQRELSRSRWRRLGHVLRLSKPLSWDLATPQRATPRAPVHPAAGSSTATEMDHVEGQFLTAEFVEQCKAFAVDVVLDVGANSGQFAGALRASGWHGQIVSFEPLSDAHAQLRKAAAGDALWDVAERCALGATKGDARINIAANSWSSSLLPMAALHHEVAPQSVYSGTESCTVLMLDDVIGGTYSDPTTLFALKIDVQGYEKQVLEGLRKYGPQVRVLLCELSLAELYDGAAQISEMTAYLAGRGFRCLALAPALEDPRTGRLLQADGLFVSR